ncbi:MAG: alpha/beta fold hydrolase [Bacteroidia bacterium]
MAKFLIILFVAFGFLITKGQTGEDSIRFVEINGKKQYYLDKGTGKPTVIFLTGLGVPMTDISEIQNQVSLFTRTITYDRAGIGRSEPLNNERHLENLTTELNELLDKIGINKAILVGHSMGGWLAQYFTYKHPEKVIGLIILDSPDISYRSKRRALRTETEKLKFDSLPGAYYMDNGEFSETIKSELKNTRTVDSALLAGKKIPVKIPLTFIASTQVSEDKYSKQDNEIKLGLLKGQLKTNPKMKLILTEKSGHFIYEDEPKLVISEIASMVNRIRNSKKQTTNK